MGNARFELRNRHYYHLGCGHDFGVLIQNQVAEFLFPPAKSAERPRLMNTRVVKFGNDVVPLVFMYAIDDAVKSCRAIRVSHQSAHIPSARTGKSLTHLIAACRPN